MRYANRAKNIKNRAYINEDPKNALLRQFQIEIEQLREQLGDKSFTLDPNASSEEIAETYKRLNEADNNPLFSDGNDKELNGQSMDVPRDGEVLVDNNIIELKRTQ